MLVFRSFEADPIEILFDFFRCVWKPACIRLTDIHVQIAKHVAIKKPVKISRDRKLAMLDFVQHVYNVCELLYTCMFIFLFLSCVGLSFCKKVCLFVLVLSLQIRSKRFSVSWFLLRHITFERCLLFVTLLIADVYTFWSIYSPKFAYEEVKYCVQYALPELKTNRKRNNEEEKSGTRRRKSEPSRKICSNI